MTFSSLGDVIKLVVFLILFLRKLPLLKSILCKGKVITDKIQWYHDLANGLRISKMYRNFFIDCSLIKIIAVQFCAI